MPDRPRIDLMHATVVPRPVHREGWVYEEKYDGWRMVAYKNGQAVRLASRSERDLTGRFAELAAAVRALPASTLILDGEVCRFDDRLVSRFEWVRRRRKDEISTPALFMVFDCLYARGKDLRERPLRMRRLVLEGELGGARLLLPARRLSSDGLAAWAEVLDRGYERLVAKDDAAPYVGGRTLKWLKVKVPRYRAGERGWEAKGKS